MHVTLCHVIYNKQFTKGSVCKLCVFITNLHLTSDRTEQFFIPVLKVDYLFLAR